MFVNSYSFADVSASYVGPGGVFEIGNGAGPGEEGISLAQTDDKGTLLMGADGSGSHSLHRAQNGVITVRVLKTSPANALLMAAYNTETQSAAVYGQGTIVVRNPVSGDVITCLGLGWKKAPDLSFGKDAGLNEWSWNAARIEYVLGTGTPSVI